MSNPTPILNNINAFDATQGTTISFNIIGGTDIVRSNIVYIYDLSTNDLICTHLYISTESIHELPPNTDSSIVYASGKSSEDFVNNKNYYLQIQTFTNTAGTAGGSGMSVAKTFWCLFDPALSVNAIPAAISTTSYNVGATYTTNITDVTIPVTNIIQQYKFDLYTATGTLVQTSGNIIGSGEQEGTSTTYNITYNFSGLVVNNSYYVIVTTTSTEGMTVSAQSNTFTVSIDTPTVGGAIVNNNACDGYISVVSNLSDEYGGSASGEIASFVTSSINDISSLKVTLTPQQDGTPWIGTDHDTTPYLNRAMPTQSNAYNRESGVIVGGTVAWNQLVQNGDFENTNGWSSYKNTLVASGNIATATIANEEPLTSANINRSFAVQSGHKYMLVYSINSSTSGNAGYYVDDGGIKVLKPISAGAWTQISAIRSATSNSSTLYLYLPEVANVVVQIKNVMAFDLTQMFGSTIADYIYSLEQATAGAGVAWFRNYFPEDYYPYSANTLQSVQATAHKTYDGDGNVIGNYALDSSLTLRGIPKLDASNNLYYDGDTYASDGTVTRKYGVVDLGTLTPIVSTLVTNGATIPISDAKIWAGGSYIPNGIVVGYTAVKSNENNFTGGKEWTIRLSTNAGGILIADPSWAGKTASEIKASLNGVYYAYELATPTTETATAYTNPQVVDPNGTEEYVTANYVPVGHDSTYSLECPISGYDEVSAVVSPTTSASDGQTYTADLPQTVYGGTVDLVTGELVIDRAMVDLGTQNWTRITTGESPYFRTPTDAIPYKYMSDQSNYICENYQYASIGSTGSAAGIMITNTISIRIRDNNYSDSQSFKTAMDGVQLCYELATPRTIQLTPHQIQTLVGTNNVWSDAGDVDVTFNLPISNLLVKRQDASDVSGNWLTLYSQPITQASDMDFTFIDFLNQHGKTYRYALVPLLTQQQGDIDVEIEGGYTVSDDVLSVFDGVFVANNNGSQKLKASTEYGDLETNQDVGVLTTIGNKYPFVVSNSNLNYHSGSISALIVPSDFYTSGDLDRLDIVERREAMEQFLTDKTAKILKDWNGNIWLITFVENVEVSFVDDYGMGLGTLSAKWVEIGDVNDQTDLQQTGLI